MRIAHRDGERDDEISHPLTHGDILQRTGRLSCVLQLHFTQNNRFPAVSALAGLSLDGKGDEKSFINYLLEHRIDERWL